MTRNLAFYTVHWRKIWLVESKKFEQGVLQKQKGIGFWFFELLEKKDLVLPSFNNFFSHRGRLGWASLPVHFFPYFHVSHMWLKASLNLTKCKKVGSGLFWKIYPWEISTKIFFSLAGFRVTSWAKWPIRPIKAEMAVPLSWQLWI